MPVLRYWESAWRRSLALAGALTALSLVLLTSGCATKPQFPKTYFRCTPIPAWPSTKFKDDAAFMVWIAQTYTAGQDCERVVKEAERINAKAF